MSINSPSSNSEIDNVAHLGCLFLTSPGKHLIYEASKCSELRAVGAALLRELFDEKCCGVRIEDEEITQCPVGTNGTIHMP